MDAGAAQRGELAGAVQVWGTAPLNPQQVDMVDLTQVGGFVESVDLTGGEVRGLVNDDACGLVAVGGAVLG
ncbi:hypothetical protein ACWIGE_29295 [Streptomyces diastaticus]